MRSPGECEFKTCCGFWVPHEDFSASPHGTQEQRRRRGASRARAADATRDCVGIITGSGSPWPFDRHLCRSGSDPQPITDDLGPTALFATHVLLTHSEFPVNALPYVMPAPLFVEILRCQPAGNGKASLSIYYMPGS